MLKKYYSEPRTQVGLLSYMTVELVRQSVSKKNYFARDCSECVTTKAITKKWSMTLLLVSRLYLSRLWVV